jgi:tetratricopeptide (TPR) repeat protein
MRQFDKAIATFEKTLEINPLHASAEFSLARSLQRTGHTAEAREHFARFQHLTSTKISSALGLSYGEQGHYSTVTAVEEPAAIQRAMIPVRLVAQPMIAAASRRFVMDDDRRGMHDGRDGLRTDGSGADASGRAGHSHPAQPWRRRL